MEVRFCAADTRNSREAERIVQQKKPITLLFTELHDCSTRSFSTDENKVLFTANSKLAYD